MHITAGLAKWLSVRGWNGAVWEPYDASPNRVPRVTDEQSWNLRKCLPEQAALPSNLNMHEIFKWSFCLCLSDTHTPSSVVVHRVRVWQYLARSTKGPRCLTTFLRFIRFNLPSTNLAQSLISDGFLYFFLLLLLFVEGVWWNGGSEERPKSLLGGSTVSGTHQGCFLSRYCNRSHPHSLVLFWSRLSLQQRFGWPVGFYLFLYFFIYFLSVRGDSWIIMF